jgi:hypothetical protein
MKSLSVVFLAVAPFALAAALRPHPRVEVTPTLIEQLRSLRDRNDPAWIRLARWVASPPRGRGPNVVLGCMLSYLVTNDRRQLIADGTRYGGRFTAMAPTAPPGLCPSSISITETSTRPHFRAGCCWA